MPPTSKHGAVVLAVSPRFRGSIVETAPLQQSRDVLRLRHASLSPTGARTPLLKLRAQQQRWALLYRRRTDMLVSTDPYRTGVPTRDQQTRSTSSRAYPDRQPSARRPRCPECSLQPRNWAAERVHDRNPVLKTVFVCQIRSCQNEVIRKDADSKAEIV